MSRIPHARALTARSHLTHFVMLGTLSIALLAGCSGEDDTTSPTTGSQGEIENGLDGLATFGVGMLDNPEAQVMANAEISAIMSEVGLGLDALGDFGGGMLGAGVTAGRGAPALPSGIDKLVRGDTSMLPNLGRMSMATIELPFGTYMRDRTDTTMPFPGWRLVSQTDPADGMIFRWDLDATGITVTENGATRPIAGELRFLDIVLDEGETEEDAIITSMRFEMALGENVLNLTTVARIAYAMTLDENREPVALEIGDESDLSSTFIGPLSFALLLSAIDDDFEVVLRLADATTAPAYVLRLGFAIVDLDPVSEIPASLTFDFGYGATSDPSNPPWELSVTLDGFVASPPPSDDWVADVNGNISFSDQVLATFTGDTTEVPVDYDANGDGVVDDDDTCVNVEITFTDTRESHSICSVFDDALDNGPIAGGLGALITQPTSPLLWLD